MKRGLCPRNNLHSLQSTYSSHRALAVLPAFLIGFVIRIIPHTHTVFIDIRDACIYTTTPRACGPAVMLSRLPVLPTARQHRAPPGVFSWCGLAASARARICLEVAAKRACWIPVGVDECIVPAAL
jgi:hypothetical protein